MTVTVPGAGGAPAFLYDLYSPYAYLAAARIEHVLPEAEWRPIFFGGLLRARDRVPWSMGSERKAGQAEVERRAHARELPPIAWPQDWPRSYSAMPARAALVGDAHGRLVEVSQAIFAAMFVDGRRADDREAILAAGEAAGLDRRALDDGLDDPKIKQELFARTQQAIDLGVQGIPAIAVGGELFWGDDQLEGAAEHASRP